MQDVLSFVQPKSNPLSLSSTPTSSAISVGTQNEEGTFSESFFSLILEKITQENNAAALDALSQELPQTTVALENSLDLETPPQSEAKSIDEHLLEDLLSVVNALQQNAQTTTFPTLKSSSNLEKILASETVRQDFANVKNVSDLLELSKKYNLGLEKLSISQENLKNLQNTFPTLTQNHFFDDLTTALNNVQDTQNNTLQTSTQTTASTQINLMSLLDKQQPKTSSTSTNSSILSELISKEIPSEPVTVQQTPKPTVQQTVDTSILQDAMETVTVEEPIVNEKQLNDTAKAAQVAAQEETSQQPLETVLQKAVNSNELKPQTKKVETQQTAQTVTSDETTPIKTVSAKTESLKTSSEDTPKEVKPLKTEPLIDSTSSEDGVTKSQTIVSSKEESHTETTQNSQDTLDIKTDLNVKVATKQDTTSTKTPSPKESLNQFASDLKEQIDSYKPPIMKVELSLSPKSLGDVDVTLVTRGNNLHVNISSNTTTMSLFTQNQDEVKSALVNMGFTNLEMNFSDQRSNDQSQQNNQNHGKGNYQDTFADETQEETTLLEIVIPQYV